jgi:hypothetical protein
MLSDRDTPAQAVVSDHRDLSLPHRLGEGYRQRGAREPPSLGGGGAETQPVRRLLTASRGEGDGVGVEGRRPTGRSRAWRRRGVGRRRRRRSRHGEGPRRGLGSDRRTRRWAGCGWEQRCEKAFFFFMYYFGGSSYACIFRLQEKMQNTSSQYNKFQRQAADTTVVVPHDYICFLLEF